MHRAWIALAGLVIAMPVRASDVIGTYDTPGEARHVALVGSLAYVADGTAGLRVLDVSVPAVPVEIGALATSPTAGPRDVVVVGSHAYVALGLGGVGVADVSIPAAPTWIAMLPLPGTVTVDVEVSGTLAFVAGGLGGLRIVDFAIPTAPVQVGSVSVGNDVSDVELSGSVAWIAAANGVYGYDVSVPSAPAFLSQPSTLASSAIEVIGDRLYTNSAEVFDISDPSAPVSISAGFSSFGDIELDGDLLVGQSSGFWVLDASDPDAPFRYGDLTHCGRAGIEVVGRYAYCIAESSGFNIYDVADPMHPLLVGSVPGIQAWALDVLGRYAYVGGSANGPLRIIDVANPAVPTIVATVPVSAFSVEVWGGIAYLGDGGDGLRVYDVRNPLAPSQIGFVPIVGPSDLELVGDRLYMAGGFDGFLIFDVSVPSTPALLGFFAPSPSGFADLVEVQNDVAYLVVTSPDRLIVLDVANPASPVQLASIPLADVDGIQIVGDLLYVTPRSSRLPR
jgi:hypothetical protein